jgi:hypothetical protein
MIILNLNGLQNLLQNSPYSIVRKLEILYGDPPQVPNGQLKVSNLEPLSFFFLNVIKVVF